MVFLEAGFQMLCTFVCNILLFFMCIDSRAGYISAVLGHPEE